MADKQLQAQKAVARLNLSRQAVADGVATPEDVFNAYQEFFEKDGVTDPNNFTTDPKIILQEQITQLQQQAQQLNQVIAQQNQVLQQGDQALEGSMRAAHRLQYRLLGFLQLLRPLPLLSKPYR